MISSYCKKLQKLHFYVIQSFVVRTVDTKKNISKYPYDVYNLHLTYGNLNYESLCRIQTSHTSYAIKTWI